jgi:hypothetical protein
MYNAGKFWAGHWGRASDPGGRSTKPRYRLLLGRLRRASGEFLDKFVYFHDAVFMYWMSAGASGAEVQLPLIPAHLSELTMDDLRQMAAANPELASAEWRNDSIRRFARGDRCWGLVRSGQVVSLVWCATDSEVPVTEVDGWIAVDPDTVYFHAAYTLARYRGVGYYPYLLHRMCDMFLDKRKLIGARVKNRSSIRGIQKAGFQPDRIYSLWRIFGFSLRSQTESVQY